MPVSHRDVLLSWLVVLVAGFVLWPPRAVYWESLAAHIGDQPTLLVVGILALGLGVAIHRATTIEIQSFVIGALAAYVSGMVAIDILLDPGSPVHLILYAAIVLCLISGGVAHRILEIDHENVDRQPSNHQ